MDDRFQGIEFLRFLGRRWPVIAVSCVVATVIAGGVCLLQAKRYTATASIMIEPPAGNDPRAATSVSPVYLESLKTYERLAASDTLFASALTALGMKAHFRGASMESVKRSVLKVSRPISSKVIEISATLNDPRDAQRLAEFIARQTVELNEQLNGRFSEGISKDAKLIFDAASARLKKAEAAKNEFTRTQSMDALADELSVLNDVRFKVERDLSESRAELADLDSQLHSYRPGDGNETQTSWTARQDSAMRARIETLEQQAAKFRRTAETKADLLEKRRQRNEFIDSELLNASTDLEYARTKLNDATTSAAYRGERLQLMDPGVVPERPSYPNTPVSLLLAALLSCGASFGYLALQFGSSRAVKYRAESEFSLR